MAPETTQTKRKSLDRKVKTTEDAPPAKKAKTTSEAPKPEKVKAAAEAKKNRKRAADFIDTAEVEVEKSEPAPKKTKKQKTAAPAVEAVDEPVATPKGKKGKVDKRSKKVEEVAEAAEQKSATPKADKKNKKIEEAVEIAASPVEKKTTKEKKPKVDKRGKKSEEVAEAVEPVVEKPAKAHKGKKTEGTETVTEVAEEAPAKSKKTKVKVDKRSKNTTEPVEVTQITEVVEEATTVTAKPKKAKVDKRTKNIAELSAAAEETIIIETVKPKKGKAAKKDAAPVEVIAETTVVETTKPKKSKAEKVTKKIVEITKEAEVVPVSILKKGKGTKKVAKPAEETEVTPTSISKPKKGKADKASKTNGEIKVVVAADPLEDAFDGFSSGEEDNIADQTAALLAGFESSDESDAAEDEGMPLNQVPSVKLTKESKKALAAANKDGDDTPGTIYVGRVPHGFYEHQMKAYFSQFGEITRLRLSRNKKTGASKHFAFIEFASSEVAEIVARTMNNYLMFGHILKVRKIPDEQVHKDLWKGAGKRFKVIPRAKLAARDLAQPKGRAYWRKKVESEETKRAELGEKMKELGYEFEMPAVRKVEDVPMKGTDDVVNVIDEVVVGVDAMEVDEPIKAIESAEAVVQDAVEKEVMSVIAKKRGKGKGGEIIGDAVKVTKKTTKEKKVKA